MLGSLLYMRWRGQWHPTCIRCRRLPSICKSFDVLVENGILHCLAQLLARNYPKSIKKQACLIVSNITAGSKNQIQAVIDADVVSPLIVLLKTSEVDIMEEAAWAISNAASGGSSDQIQYLVSRGCLEPPCNVLTYQDADLVYTCLEGLQNNSRRGSRARDPGRTHLRSLF